MTRPGDAGEQDPAEYDQPIEPIIVGQDEIPDEVFEAGGFVVGRRQKDRCVVFVCYEPGGTVAFSVDVDPRMAEAIGRALIENAAKVRAADSMEDQS